MVSFVLTRDFSQCNELSALRELIKINLCVVLLKWRMAFFFFSVVKWMKRRNICHLFTEWKIIYGRFDKQKIFIMAWSKISL